MQSFSKENTLKYTSVNAIVEKLRNDITSRPEVAIKAMQRIYSYQTASEQKMKATTNYNGVGFTGADARSLSYYSQLLEKGYTLRPDVIQKIQKRMPKYAGQLVNQSIEKCLIKKVGSVYVW